MAKKWDELAAKARREHAEKERVATEHAARERAQAEARARAIRADNAAAATRAKSVLPEARKAIHALIAADTGHRTSSGGGLDRLYEDKLFGRRFVGWRAWLSQVDITIRRNEDVRIKAGQIYTLEAAVREGNLRWTTHYSDSRSSYSTDHVVGMDELLEQLMEQIADYVGGLR